MNVHFTELAKENISQHVGKQQGLKLLYDTEGCGCSVDGVFTLTTQADKEEADIELASNFIPVWVEARHEVFLDEKMTVDYLPKYQTYMLKSDQQILNPRMRLTRR